MKRLWVVILAVIVALIVAAGLALANSKIERARAAHAALERRISTAAGLTVADPDKALEVFAELQAQIEAIRDVAPKVEIVETIRWRTNPINTSLKELAEHRKAELERIRRQRTADIEEAKRRVEAARPGCGGLISPADCEVIYGEIPQLGFEFSVMAIEARLLSETGNRFAAITASIYEGDCEGPDGCWMVGTADGRADLSDLRASLAPPAMKRLGWYGGAQYALDAAGSSPRLRAYGGPEWRWTRLAARAGVFVERDAAGLDVALSWRGRR